MGRMAHQPDEDRPQAGRGHGRLWHPGGRYRHRGRHRSEDAEEALPHRARHRPDQGERQGGGEPLSQGDRRRPGIRHCRDLLAEDPGQVEGDQRPRVRRPPRGRPGASGASRPWPADRTIPIRPAAARSRRWPPMAFPRTISPASLASIRRRCASTTGTNSTPVTSRPTAGLPRASTGRPLGDGPQIVTAAIFWLKTRARWKETVVNEVSVATADPLTQLLEQVAETGRRIHDPQGAGASHGDDRADQHDGGHRLGSSRPPHALLGRH